MFPSNVINDASQPNLEQKVFQGLLFPFNGDSTKVVFLTSLEIITLAPNKDITPHHATKVAIEEKIVTALLFIITKDKSGSIQLTIRFSKSR